MSSQDRIVLTAGEREAHVDCAHCADEIVLGQQLIVCPDCGAVHHPACWQAGNGCGAYECAPSRKSIESRRESPLKINTDELDRAVPLPAAGPPASEGRRPPLAESKPPAKTSGLALAGFGVAAAGAVLLTIGWLKGAGDPPGTTSMALPLSGLILAFAAILLAGIAAGTLGRPSRRGVRWVAGGVVLGLGDIVGAALLLSSMVTAHEAHVDLARLEMDPAALEHLAPHVRRATMANVLIRSQETRFPGRMGIGSGVVLQVDSDRALVLTNRHVVDPEFERQAGPATRGASGGLTVKLIGQPLQPGRVVWLAPDGVDLALLRVPIVSDEIQAAQWPRTEPLNIGEEVFAIGNPYQLGWTHTAGAISQLRVQRRGGRRIRIIQTNAAINSGNSGGGLYDREGNLIGIVTWTNDKRVSEGLGFAIALDSFLAMDPPGVGSPADDEAAQRHPEE